MRNYDSDPADQLRATYDATSKFGRVDFVAINLKVQPNDMAEALPKPVFPPKAVIIEFPRAEQTPAKSKELRPPSDFTGSWRGMRVVKGEVKGPLKQSKKGSGYSGYVRTDTGWKFSERGR
jgi:hypothetical protein